MEIVTAVLVTIFGIYLAGASLTMYLIAKKNIATKKPVLTFREVIGSILIWWLILPIIIVVTFYDQQS